MQTNFSFNPKKYNFWPIYEAIKKYYPLGVSQESACHFNYPGMKALEEIVVKNIHDKDTYQTQWENFEKSIAQELNKEVIGTTYGQAPCFSAYLNLNSWMQEQYTIQKELHFAVSLAGPFFTIYGKELARFTEPDAKEKYPSIYQSTIAYTVSPFGEYENIFIQLKQRIEARFGGYKFIPFAVCEQYIEGLHLPYFDRKVNTVYNALLNHLLFDEYQGTVHIRGDKYYGYDTWKTDAASP